MERCASVKSSRWLHALSPLTGPRIARSWATLDRCPGPCARAGGAGGRECDSSSIGRGLVRSSPAGVLDCAIGLVGQAELGAAYTALRSNVTHARCYPDAGESQASVQTRLTTLTTHTPNGTGHDAYKKAHAPTLTQSSAGATAVLLPPRLSVRRVHGWVHRAPYRTMRMHCSTRPTPLAPRQKRPAHSEYSDTFCNNAALNESPMQETSKQPASPQAGASCSAVAAVNHAATPEAALGGPPWRRRGRGEGASTHLLLEGDVAIHRRLAQQHIRVHVRGGARVRPAAVHKRLAKELRRGREAGGRAVRGLRQGPGAWCRRRAVAAARCGASRGLQGGPWRQPQPQLRPQPAARSAHPPSRRRRRAGTLRG
jgi:hypothetical protein